MDELPEPDSPDYSLAAVILAAGMGTRMRSGLPKVLHRVAGDPLVSHVIDAARRAGIAEVLVVVGHGRDLVMSSIGDGVRYTVQQPQLGTGHALRLALSAMDRVPARLVVLCGDAPLITAETVRRMVSEEREATVVVLSAMVDDPAGYGRIVRDGSGSVRAIVEEADATEEQHGIREINSGFYCLDGAWAAANIGKIGKSSGGEYYLTDLVAAAVEQGREVRAVLADDPAEVLGVNDRAQLASADAVLRSRICQRLMRRGITIVDPATTYIGKDVTVGPDTVIQPGTHLRGATSIGERCEIGPNTIIEESVIGDDCVVVASMLERASVASGVSIGPFSHLRPGAAVASGAKIGNYAEIKNSSIGEGVQMHHFSYIGDAEVGAGTNVGAGTITCNYDGRTRRKFRTKIGKGVFLGSDTLLRAPVEVGDGAQTGAGAVVTKDVPPGMLALGMPARITKSRGREETSGTDSETEGGGGERGS